MSAKKKGHLIEPIQGGTVDDCFNRLKAAHDFIGKKFNATACKLQPCQRIWRGKSRCDALAAGQHAQWEQIEG